jgi:hypothetical protein
VEPVEYLVWSERSAVGSTEDEPGERIVRITPRTGCCSCVVPEGGGDAR